MPKELFEIKDFNVTFSPQALSLKPFKALWDRDKTKDKRIAIAELNFLFYFADARSDFHNILDEDTRAKDIVEQVAGLPKDWEPDEKVKVAIDFYRKRSQTISSILLEDGEHAAGKLSTFLRNINLNERNDKGGLVYSPKAIADVLKTLPDVVTSLIETKKKVAKDQKEAGGARGSVEKGVFEDGIN